MIRGLVVREWALFSKRLVIYSSVVYILVVLAIVLAIGKNAEVLPLVGPGILWSLLVMCSLFMSPGLIEQDYRDGFLDQLVSLRFPLVYWVLVKWLSLWATVALPPLLMVPLAMGLFSVPVFLIVPFLIKFFVASLYMVLQSVLGSTLILGSQRNHMWGYFLMMPMIVPALIIPTLPIPTGEAVVLLSGGLLLVAPLYVFLTAQAVRYHIMCS